MKVYIGPYDDGEQEIQVRIDPYDTWSMDSTLAVIVVPMLEQLRDTLHGFPVNDDVVDEEAWRDILGQMIWAFQQYLIDWEEPYYKEGGLDMDGLRDHTAKMQVGFELFGKYYQTLWD